MLVTLCLCLGLGACAIGESDDTAACYASDDVTAVPDDPYTCRVDDGVAELSRTSDSCHEKDGACVLKYCSTLCPGACYCTGCGTYVVCRGTGSN